MPIKHLNLWFLAREGQHRSPSQIGLLMLLLKTSGLVTLFPGGVSWYQPILLVEVYNKDTHPKSSERMNSHIGKSNICFYYKFDFQTTLKSNF